MVENLGLELPPGSRLGHFEVGELIGAGGMGVVFRARDVRLGRWVALKVLSRGLFDNESARKRFLREAQLASTLSHPNVATVYEIDEESNIAFIAMELVQGRDLKSVLALSGRLAIEDAVKLGAQVADALAAAHEAGIIHRDIKASNIMISPDGRVKVLDFGLAKGLDSTRENDLGALEGSTPRADEPTIREPSQSDYLRHTKSGVIVGTPSYMSPEQASGRTVDTRSDIFSLGIVLYEAVTGELPFRGNSESEILAAVRSLEPSPLHESRREIPRRFSRVVSTCLAKRPEDRFQSAADLQTALQRVTRRSLTGSLTSGAMAPVLKSHRTRTVGLAAGVFLLLLAVFVALHDSSRSAFQRRDWILIADFENLTDDPKLGDALGAAFRIGLEQSRYANVLPQADVAQAFIRMRRTPGEKITRELGAEVCQREGVRGLLMGQVVQIGPSFKLSAELVEPSTQRTVLVETKTVPGREALIGGIEGLTETIRSELGESLSTIASASQPLERVTSRSLDALYAFSQGMKEMARADDAEAIKFFERAVELDPEFAMAHARAGLVYYTTGTSRARALAHWREALKYVDRLTEYEKLYVQGSEARLNDPPEALRMWSMMRSLYPTSIVGHHNAAVAYWQDRNDFVRAADGFAAAAATDAPRSFVSVSAQGYMELAMGRFSPALAYFRDARRRSPNPLTSGLADVLIAMKRYDDAIEVLDEAERLSIPFSVMEARARRAALYLDRGQLSEARGLYEEALTRSSGSSAPPRAAASRVALDACLEHEGEEARLRERLQRDIEYLVDVMGAPDEKDYSTGLRLGLVTKIRFRNFGAQGTEAATRVLEQRAAELDFMPWKAYASMLSAEGALASGDPARSVAELKRALSTIDLFQLHETLARAYRAEGKMRRGARRVSLDDRAPRSGLRGKLRRVERPGDVAPRLGGRPSSCRGAGRGARSAGGGSSSLSVLPGPLAFRRHAPPRARGGAAAGSGERFWNPERQMRVRPGT